MQEEAAGRQDEERDPGVGGAQEPIVYAPDQEGAGGTAYGFEEFGQDLPGEGPTAAAAGDDAVGGATVGGAAVGAAGDGFGIGETIEDASGPVLDPPGAAGDVPFGGAFDPVGEAITDVGRSPGAGDALGGIAPDVVGGDVGDVGEQAGGEAVDAALYGPGMGNPAPSAPPQAAPETAAPAAEATTADEGTNYRIDSEGKVWVDADDHDRLVDNWNTLVEETESQQQFDALADAAEDVGEAVADFVETLPFVGDALGDALGDAHDVVEDVIDHMDAAVVEDVDPWG